MRKLEIVLDESTAGKSLDKSLKDIFGLNKRQISQAKFRENGICVNGKQVRISYIGKPGDFLEVCVEEERSYTGKVVPVSGELDILYEDKDLIVLNKPGGIPCHPGRGHYEDSLANRVAAYCMEKGETSLIRAVGRLDKDTSGIVVFAKNQIAAARLSLQKEEGIFRKEYLVLVKGKLETGRGRILEPIGNVPGEKMKMQVDANGKEADTAYEVLEVREEYSLVKCVIRTGRTHQIRVHMAWLGHPVLGDVLYGDGENPVFEGLALHAWKTEFYQPFTGEKAALKVVPVHWNVSRPSEI